MEAITLDTFYGKIKVYSKYGKEFLPKRSTRDSAGFDIVAAEDISLPHGFRTAIDTGLIIDASEIKIPLMIMILPRCSTGAFDDFMISNTAAVIDKDYNGKTDYIYVFAERKPVGNILNNRITQKLFKAKEYFINFFTKDTDSDAFRKLVPRGYDPLDKAEQMLERSYSFPSNIKTKFENDTIKKGMAYAQLIFVPVLLPEVEHVELDGIKNKNRGGMGSTGK